MDRLTASRVFIEVADRGSLTQAAERLDMSAAMVSRYLAAAEAWLGARLLHRTTRRVSLTDAGQAALPTCRQWLELAEEMRHRAGNRSREPEGKLRVTTAASFAEAQLTTAIVDFQRLHPKVQVELLVVDRAVDLVEERIDLAVRISNSLEPHLVSRPLGRCRSVLCATNHRRLPQCSLKRWAGAPILAKVWLPLSPYTESLGSGMRVRFRFTASWLQPHGSQNPFSMAFRGTSWRKLGSTCYSPTLNQPLLKLQTCYSRFSVK